MDLHGYGHWSCQLALLAGLRTMYHRFMQPNGRFPNSDLVVSFCRAKPVARLWHLHIAAHWQLLCMRFVVVVKYFTFQAEL